MFAINLLIGKAEADNMHQGKGNSDSEGIYQVKACLHFGVPTTPVTSFYPSFLLR